MATPKTTDVIIGLSDRPGRPIVLIRRRYPPAAWALPGGFVDLGECVETAAIREARGETGLEILLKALFGCYSDPKRDPRAHAVSVVYVAEAHGTPAAADDVAGLEIFIPERIPAELAFDHGRILRDYLVYRQSGKLPRPPAADAVGRAGVSGPHVAPTLLLQLHDPGDAGGYDPHPFR